MTKELEQQGQKGIFLPLQDSIKVKLGDEELIIRDTGFSIKKMNSNQAVQEYGQDSPEYLNYLKKVHDFALQDAKLDPNSSVTRKIIGQTKQLVHGLTESSIIKTAATFMILANQISLASTQGQDQFNSTKANNDSDDEKVKFAGISVGAIVAAAALILISCVAYKKIEEYKQKTNKQHNPNIDTEENQRRIELQENQEPVNNDEPEKSEEIFKQGYPDQASSSNQNHIQMLELYRKTAAIKNDGEYYQQNQTKFDSKARRALFTDKVMGGEEEISENHSHNPDLPIEAEKGSSQGIRTIEIQMPLDHSDHSYHEEEARSENHSHNRNSSIEAEKGSQGIKTIEIQTQSDRSDYSYNEEEVSRYKKNIEESSESLSPESSTKVTKAQSFKTELITNDR